MLAVTATVSDSTASRFGRGGLGASTKPRQTPPATPPLTAPILNSSKKSSPSAAVLQPYCLLQPWQAFGLHCRRGLGYHAYDCHGTSTATFTSTARARPRAPAPAPCSRAAPHLKPAASGSCGARGDVRGVRMGEGRGRWGVELPGVSSTHDVLARSPSSEACSLRILRWCEGGRGEAS